MKSKKYKKIKLWYDMGMWNEIRVRNAVVKEWITEEEFTKITGKSYGDVLVESVPTISNGT